MCEQRLVPLHLAHREECGQVMDAMTLDTHTPQSGLCVLASQAAPETKGGSLGPGATSGVTRCRAARGQQPRLPATWGPDALPGARASDLL